MAAHAGSSRGHRLVAHPADVILEAWGPRRGECLSEAVAALVDAFADISAATPTDRVRVDVDGDDLEDVLVGVLEEVVYLVDGYGLVPVRAEFDDTTRGAHGSFETVPAETVEVTGALPKGISRSDLVFEEREGSWWCRVLVDV